MFRNNKVFNQPLSSWNTSNVTNIDLMFSGCSAFNQDLSSWDTSNVTDMSQTFADCVEFNQDVSSWDISSVTDMSALFKDCKKFNKPILWDLRNVTSVSTLLSGCEQFNQDVSGWNLGESGQTLSASNLFSGCSSFDQDISSWKYRNFVYNFQPYPPFDTINFGFVSFLANCGMSPQNYDLFLQALDSESNFAPLNTQVNYLTNTGVAYTAGGAGEAARNSLVAKGWVIEDAGAV
jgi:surface protein